MKLILALLVICFAAIGNTLTVTSAADSLMFAIADCRLMIPHVGNAITQKFLNHDLNLNREERCFVACIMQRLFLMTDNGYMVKGSFIEAINLMIPDDPAQRQIATEVVTGCELVHENDVCDSAVEIAKCINDGKDARGLATFF